MHVTVLGLPLASFGMLAGVMTGLLVAATMARRWDLLLDRPGSLPVSTGPRMRRKMHEQETPQVGGVVLLAGMAVAMMVLPFPWEAFWTLPFGLATLGLLGLVDDLYDVRAHTRFVLQFLVAFVVVVFGGIEIHSLGNLLGFGPVALGPFSAPVTILSLMLIVNAVNMLDGIDGLAGSVALIASLAFGIVAFTAGQPILGTLSVLLAAALTGFLFFNLRTPWRRRASVFLGDSGSMMLGFWMGWMAVALTQMPGSQVAPATVALFLIFPAADALAVFVRRGLLRRNPMHADRGHTHHVLLRAGFTVSRTVGVLLLFYTFWVAFGLHCHFRGCPELPQLLLAAIVFVGYIAFVLNGRRFIRGCRRSWRRGPGLGTTFRELVAPRF